VKKGGKAPFAYFGVHFPPSQQFLCPLQFLQHLQSTHLQSPSLQQFLQLQSLQLQLFATGQQCIKPIAVTIATTLPKNAPKNDFIITSWFIY
jgi:hypothetical protein